MEKTKEIILQKGVDLIESVYYTTRKSFMIGYPTGTGPQ